MAKKGSGGKWILFLLLLLLACGGYYYWNQKRGAEKPLEFRSAKVSRGELVQSVTASGQVTPLVTVQVGSQVSGIIQKLYTDFNETVTNGQLLAELEASSFRAAVRQSEGNLANAEASLELARINARRSEELFQKNLVARSDYDKTQADLKLAEAQVKIQSARLMEAQINLDRASIHSPIDGVVVSRNMDAGQTVAASFNAPVLFQIANDLRKMQIHAMVSEADIGGVEKGQDVTFTVDAFPARTFQGLVEQVRYAATTNQSVVTYATVITVPNKDLKLRPGMTANVSIITARQKEALRVPNAALRFRPPDSAMAKPATNTVLARTTNQVTATGGGGSQGEGGSPPPDNMPSLDQMPEQFRQRILSRFDKNGDGQLDGAEQVAWREDMAKRFGSGGPPGRGGEGRRGGGSQQVSTTRTIYRLKSTSDDALGAAPLLEAIEVKIGISDGSFTEIKEGLSEGDELATGLLNPPPASAANSSATANRPTNPFGGPGGGFRR